MKDVTRIGTEVSEIANKHKFSFSEWKPDNAMMSFVANKTRINVWLTKMTVQVCRPSKNGKNDQEFFKRVSLPELDKIFDDNKFKPVELPKVDTRAKLEILKSFYENNRGSGNTRLLKDGFIDYNSTKIVLLPTISDSKKLGFPSDRNSRVVGLDSIVGLNNTKAALAIDNSAMIELLKETLEYIKNLEEKFASKQ